VEFTNQFTVPVGVDRAFEILTDLERVAPCLPGATLEEVDGDTYTGRVKVKVGPMAVTYRGTAEVTEKDTDAHRAVIHAARPAARGAGTAAADVTAHLTSDGDGTTSVTVVTDLTVTGKPAQFGRGVMADVGTKLIDTFAERLRTMLESDEVDEAVPPATPAPTADTDPEPAPVSPLAATGPRRIPPPAEEPEALDLMEVAGGAVTKRLVPLVALLVAVAGLLWWLRNR
jgi:carbon monoxide dehydrogenase subunit G